MGVVRRLLEFRLVDDGRRDRHRLVSGAGSVLEFAANGTPPPGRLVVLFGARGGRAVPVSVRSRRPDGSIGELALPGSTRGVLTFSACEAPHGGPESVLLLPVAPLPEHRAPPVPVRTSAPVASDAA